MLGCLGKQNSQCLHTLLRAGIIFSTSFVCCHRGAVGSPDTLLWQLSHGQDTPPARKCGFHRAHQALRSLPGFCLGLPGSPHPPVGRRYFGVTAHVYNPALSGYVVVTFLKSFCGSHFSLGNPGQMAEILTFWQDKNSS